jgi:hypothetical protein
MLEIFVCYVVGTLFGYMAFKNMNRESIITTTLDTLIADDYVRSWEDEEGKIHLYKWYETSIEEEENEKDDTP